MRKQGLISLLIVAFVLSVSAICSAQTVSSTTAPLSLGRPVTQQDSETLKSLEIALIRLKAAEEREKLLNDRLAEKDEVIKAKDGTIAVKDEMIGLLKSATSDRKQAGNIDDLRLADAHEQLAKADARIHQLEHPGFFRTLFDVKTLSGAGLGYIGCKATNSFGK